jgi:hypothetical protein
VKQLQELQQAREDENVVQQQDKAIRMQEREQEKRLKAQAVAERKVARQEKAEQRKAAIAARIASKAAARLARAAALRQNTPNQDVCKKSRRKEKQLQKPREMQDDEDMIVVKSRRSNPNTDVSSSGRLIKPSKRPRQ